MSFKMPHNGSGIAAVGEFGNRQLNLALKFHSSTTVEVCSSAPIEAIPCWRFVVFPSVKEK